MKFSYEITVETQTFIGAESDLGDSCGSIKNRRGYNGAIKGENLVAIEEQIHELLRKAIKAAPHAEGICSINVAVFNGEGL